METSHPSLSTTMNTMKTDWGCGSNKQVFPMSELGTAQEVLRARIREDIDALPCILQEPHPGVTSPPLAAEPPADDVASLAKRLREEIGTHCSRMKWTRPVDEVLQLLQQLRAMKFSDSVSSLR